MRCSVTLVSVLRLRTLVALLNTDDFTYAVELPGIWSIIEVDVGILCACMPGIRALLSALFPKLVGSTRDKKQSYYYGNDISGKGASFPQFSSREEFRKSVVKDDFIEIRDIEKNSGNRTPSDGNVEPQGTVCHIKAGSKGSRSNSMNKFARGETMNAVALERDPVYMGEGITVSHETRVQSDTISPRNFSRVTPSEGAEDGREPRIYRANWDWE